MTTKKYGPLYIGVTNDLGRRSYEHKNGKGGIHTSKYRLRTLIYAEQYEDITVALGREQQLKEWHRMWKIELIEKSNPTWEPLAI